MRKKKKIIIKTTEETKPIIYMRCDQCHIILCSESEIELRKKTFKHRFKRFNSIHDKQVWKNRDL